MRQSAVANFNLLIAHSEHLNHVSGFSSDYCRWTLYYRIYYFFRTSESFVKFPREFFPKINFSFIFLDSIW